MKRVLLTFIIFLSGIICHGQEVVWHDASEFPVFGKITDDTPTRYQRLPGYLEPITRKPVWGLGRNSAGLYIRFYAEGSMSLYFKWKLFSNKSMAHMADTGVKGLDLYALSDENGWRYLRCAKPEGAENEVKLVCGKAPREYMLYLPLYDGVSSLKIGIEEGGTLGQPEIMSPNDMKPVIMYGSSILQGCSASRPGMAHTNILARMIDREVINLGFSGNAKLDYEIAELMASYSDPGLFVLDYVPNCSAEMIDEKAETFFRIIRDAHPDVPIILVQNAVLHGTDIFDRGAARITKAKNDAQRRLYDKLRKEGDKNLYFVEGDGMVGYDGDTTVDGTHFTDLGMMRYAEHILPTIKKILKIK
ncbi:MAG: hydrolase [Bacteroidales bacterium]|nr:hydrolase [Bacteroidales bacterium]